MIHANRIAACAFAAACLCLAAGEARADAKNIIRMSSDIEVAKGMVVNDVIAIGGSVRVSGRVENNIVCVGGDVSLNDDAYVGGEVVVIGGEVSKSSTALVADKIRQIYMPSFIPSIVDLVRGRWIALWATLGVLAFLGFLGLSVLFAALIPDHISKTLYLLERSFFEMLGWGVLWMILVVPIAILLAISIVGIIIIPVEIAVVAFALILGFVTSAAFIGKRVMAPVKAAIPFLEVIVGVVILSFMGFVPIVGPIVKAVFVIAGFGAIIMTRFGTLKAR